jgi:hypothetical protein
MDKAQNEKIPDMTHVTKESQEKLPAGEQGNNLSALLVFI